MQQKQRLLYWVDGMSCASCASNLAIRLNRLDCVNRAHVSFEDSYALVDVSPDPQKDSDKLLSMAAREMGYSLNSANTASRIQQLEGQRHSSTMRMLFAAIFTMWSMLSASITYVSDASITGEETFRLLTLVSGITSIPVVLFFASPIYKMAWGALKQFRYNLDLMVATGALTAFFISIWRWFTGSYDVYFDTACMLILLQLGGKSLDVMWRKTSLYTLNQRLQKHTPMVTRVCADGLTDVVSLMEVEPGNRIRVQRGERLYVDAVLDSSNANLDVSLLTGESAPVTLHQGDMIHSGGMNEGGQFEAIVLRSAGNTYSDLQLLDVLSSRAKSPKAHHFIDKISAHVSTIILVIALLVFIGNLVMGVEWLEGLDRMLAVLVIACPCALTLAIPFTSTLFHHEGLRNGFLFNSIWALYRGADSQQIVFDKTGTLTKNRLSVSTIYAGNGISDSFVLSYASKLSDYSGHRYSHAIQAESLRRHIPPVQQPGDGEDVAGYGVHWESKDESDHFLLGSRAFLLEAGVPYVPDFSYSGCYLAYNQKFAGFIRIEDELKAAAQHVIHSIKQENFQTILLSGDISSSCQRVANTLEIDRCVGEQKPQEKQKHLEDFRRQGSVVYVGDGLNDNLALSTADLGVTLENATTLTQVCASVVILKGDISQLPLLLKFSYNFRKIVHQNLVFSLLYNMIAIPLAASGILSPLLAIGAMLCSSLSITLNTWLRVRKIGVSKEAIHKGEQYKAAFE